MSKAIRLVRRMADSAQQRRRAYLLAAASGVLYFVGFCGFDQYYLSWLCLVPVLWALDDESLSGWEALAIAWLFGLVTHMGGYTWIVGMLRKFAYLPLPLALLGYFLLCLGQGSLLGAWGWLVNRFSVRLKIPMLWSAPVLMVVCEWLYPALFPSFLSNSQYRQITVIQSLDIWGPLGLTFLITLCSSVAYASLAARIRKRGRIPRIGWAVFGALFVGNLIYGVGATANIDDTVSLTDERIRIGVVQTAMGIYEKTKNPREGHRRLITQSMEMQAQGADLILWPESGYYYPIREGTGNVKRQVMGPLETPLLFGAIRTVWDETGRDRRAIYNSSFLADADGNLLGSYDKTFLLAFGEYLPLGDWLPFLYDLSPQTSHFERGAHTRPLVLDGIRYGVLICYEDILPGFVRQVMQSDPHVLINLTNDAWFGKTREPLIHLALAAFRAVENRRFLVRSTNTGISAFIDPAGRIVEQTPVFARANMIRAVAPLQIRTFYARLGDWMGVLCLAASLWWMRTPLRRMFGGKKEGAGQPTA